MIKKHFFVISTGFAIITVVSCGSDPVTTTNLRGPDSAAQGSGPDSGSLGIQSASLSANLFESYFGILDAKMPDGTQTLCSGVFVSVASPKPGVWFVSAKHCLVPHDPLGRPPTYALSSIPLNIHRSRMVDNFPVEASNRFVRDDVIKMNVTSFNAKGLPLCEATPLENSLVDVVGAGRNFYNPPSTASGRFVKTPPANGPDLSTAFAQGLQFVLPTDTNYILYGEPGDSGGPVLFTKSAGSYCVAGVMSRQYPLRHTGFGLTGITPLDSYFTDPSSWTAP